MKWSFGKMRGIASLLVGVAVGIALTQSLMEPPTSTAPPVGWPQPNANHLYAGPPTPTRGQHVVVLENIGYVVGYSEQRRNPLWAAYRLGPHDGSLAPKRPDYFSVDRRTIARISEDDYPRSGYDRGHLAPNYAIATRYGRKAQLETFQMSNIVPQKHDLNGEAWNDLEQIIASRYANELAEVWVITGPIFDEQIERLKSGVEVPDAFYKIVLDELNGRPRALAFIMPQTARPKDTPQQYLTTVDAVEQATGLDFFVTLPDDIEEQMESAWSGRMW